MTPPLRARLERRRGRRSAARGRRAHPRRAHAPLRARLQRAGRADREIGHRPPRWRRRGSASRSRATRSRLYREDPLPLQRRQALGAVEGVPGAHPETPESAERRRARAAARRAALAAQLKQRALDAGRARRSTTAEPTRRRALAERALRFAPEDRGAQRLLERAERERRTAQREAAARSSRFELPPGARARARGHARARAGAARSGRQRRAPRAAAIAARSPRSRDEARFARALALSSAGARGRSRGRVRARSPKAAAAWRATPARRSADPEQNPWRHFVAARSPRPPPDRALRRSPAARGLPAPTPDGVALWLIGLPGMARASLSLPLRLIQLPWLPPPPTERRTALHARRYLALQPHGAHAERCASGSRTTRATAATTSPRCAWPRRASRCPDSRRCARRPRSRASRWRARSSASTCAPAMLDGVAQRFPGHARPPTRRGSCCCEEIADATPQRIASAALPDREPGRGGRARARPRPRRCSTARRATASCTPTASRCVGGRRDRDRLRRGVRRRGRSARAAPGARVSDEQLARLVALLEETSFRNALLDADDPVVHDAGATSSSSARASASPTASDARPERAPSYTYTRHARALRHGARARAVPALRAGGAGLARPTSRSAPSRAGASRRRRRTPCCTQ